MARGVFSTANYLKVDSGIITATPLTIAAWVYPTSVAANQYIAGLFYTSAGSGTVLEGWALRIQATTGTADAVVGNGTGTNLASSASGLTLNAWNHCVAKFVSTTSRYAYLNGTAGTQGTNSNAPVNAPDKTAIGVFIRENGSLIQAATACWVAEVAFWNTDLSDAEVASLADGFSPLLVRPQNLVGLYPLIRGDASGDEPNPKNAAYKMVEQGTISVQTHPRVFYPAPRIIIGAGGTVYDQSAAGSITPVGALIKQALKTFTGTLTPSGTVDKSTTKSFTGTLTPVGTLLKQTLKSFSGDLTPSGVLTAMKMAAVSVAATLTPVGTLLAQALKSLSGSVTPDGELTKQIIKSLSGSITPGGVLTKQTNKNADGSLTPSGVLTTIKAFLRDLSGTLTPTGDVNKSISKSPSGTAPSSGDVDKDVSKSLTGAVTPTGDAAKSTAKSFTGSLTPSGILSSIRTFARDVSGSLSPSGDLTVQTQKSPSGQVLPSGALIKQTLKTLAGSTTPSGILTTLFIPGAPAVPGGGVESWGGAFTDDINPRPRRRTVPQTPIDDDEEAILAILLSRLRK